MARKQIKVPDRILFGWFMLASLIIFFTPEKWTNKLQSSFARVLRQPLSVGRKAALSRWIQTPSSELVSRSRYNLLRNDLANLKEWLSLERQKVETLSGLRERSVWKGVDFMICDVITASVSASQSKLVINRGKNDGLAEGQFALGNRSIIGTICKVDSRTAQVRLITDPASRIAVKIAESSDLSGYHEVVSQSSVGTIMEGNGNNSAKVRLLPTKHKVKLGNVVYAEKKPGFLDTPMIVGTVAQYSRDNENPLLWDILVEPACDIETLHEVVVIIMNPQK
ncbi:MAG: rod shape-determining protein MreC [Planctomycetota bacterium]